MEQISTEKKIIIRKDRAMETRESGKRSRATAAAGYKQEEEIYLTCSKRIKPNHVLPKTPNQHTPNNNNTTILCANGSPESKWNQGILLSSPLSEHLTAFSSSNLDEDTLSECSRFRVPAHQSHNFLFSDDEEEN